MNAEDLMREAIRAIDAKIGPRDRCCGSTKSNEDLASIRDAMRRYLNG